MYATMPECDYNDEPEYRTCKYCKYPQWGCICMYTENGFLDAPQIKHPNQKAISQHIPNIVIKRKAMQCISGMKGLTLMKRTNKI